jgi:hypothetical protein
VILRSLLEACVDLRNVAHDAAYLKNMTAAQLGQQARGYREARRPGAEDNPYFRTLRSSGEERAAEITAELEALREEGFEELSIRERFERAGEGNRYTSVYYLLCLDSHHNLGALERRHLIREKDGFGLGFFKPEGFVRLTLEADAVAVNVANAVADVSRLLDGEVRDMDSVGACFESFGVVRKALLAELKDDEEE